MSFQSLISGSECAVPLNPLSQVLKHTEGDRSLQQNRIAGPSSSRLHQLPGTSSSATSQQDLVLARQFFEANARGPNAGLAFSLPHPADLARIAEVTGRSGPDLHEAWIMEQQKHMRSFESNASQSAWAAEFGDLSQSRTSGPSIQQNMTARPDSQRMSSGNFYQPMSGMYPMNMGQGNFPSVYNLDVQQGTGKGKSREADFEAAFAQAAAAISATQPETARVVEVDDGVADIEEAFKNSSLKAESEGAEQGPDFRRVWDQLQNSDAPPPNEDLAKWEAEFNQLMNSQRDDLDVDYTSAMQHAWENGLADVPEPNFGQTTLKFDENGLPILGEYVFEQNNKHMGPSTSSLSCLSQAKSLLAENGSLSEAALLLEAAIQKGELGEGGYETWILLGEVRNMDEREDAGMKALTEGVRRAEAAGAPGAGMLSLAISFTNESLERASHSMLLRWLLARFPSHPVPEDTITAMRTHSVWDTHTRLTDVFLGLARSQHAQGIVDPDVQIGLGILFYTNSEYDRAKDCFESALSAHPEDFVLWNRLGSCLSNGSKPEEALGAYREALRIRPTYTRAIYNVGVACLNIGAHKEAAEHFLSALSMQEATAGETSDQLWFTLRRTLISMERSDLAGLTETKTRGNLDAFRKEGFDF